MSDKYIITGKFGAPHGVRGWIKIHSDTDPVDALINYQPWHVKTKTAWQLIKTIDTQRHKTGLIAQIKGYDDRDQVNALTGKDIAITRKQLPKLPEDEFYWVDLEGMTVITIDDVELGKVAYLFSTGSNDVMVVKGKRKHLIPFLRETTVKGINRDEKRIIVDWDPTF